MKTNRLMAMACSALMVGTAFVALPSVTQAATDSTDLIMNPDFEEGKTVGWDITGDRCVDIATKAGDMQGKGAMHFWKDKDFKFTASQVVEDVPDGTYTVTVMTQGGGGEKAMQLFAECNGQKKTADIKNTGWNKWQTWTVSGVEVKGGKLTIGVLVDGNAGNWGSFDNFTLTKE